MADYNMLRNLLREKVKQAEQWLTRTLCTRCEDGDLSKLIIISHLLTQGVHRGCRTLQALEPVGGEAQFQEGGRALRPARCVSPVG